MTFLVLAGQPQAPPYAEVESCPVSILMEGEKVMFWRRINKHPYLPYRNKIKCHLSTFHLMKLNTACVYKSMNTERLIKPKGLKSFRQRRVTVHFTWQ